MQYSVSFSLTKRITVYETKRNGLQYTFIDGGKNEEQKKSRKIKSDFTNRDRKGEENQ
jgi:hypothetical protein